MDEEPDTIVLELTPREAAVIRRLSCFFAWEGGDFGSEMRAVFRALSEDDVMELIRHINVGVRYRDTHKLMATDALVLEEIRLRIVTV